MDVGIVHGVTHEGEDYVKAIDVATCFYAYVQNQLLKPFPESWPEEQRKTAQGVLVVCMDKVAELCGVAPEELRNR